MKYSAFAIVVLCVLSGLSKGVRSFSTYTVKNEAVECFNGDVETAYECQFKLVGRQRLINGTSSVNVGMASDHYKVQLQLFSSPLGTDQFRLLPMGMPAIGICEGFRYLYAKVVQPSFIQGENTNFPFVPEEGLCPIPKGKYWFKNIELSTNAWPNQIPRGIIKVVITFSKTRLMLVAMQYICESKIVNEHSG